MRAKLPLFLSLLIVPVVAAHCGGNQAEETPVTAPSASATTTASASSSTAAATPTVSVHCPAPKPPPTSSPATAKAGCPDMSTVEAVGKLDFAKELKVDRKLAGQLRNAALVAVAMRDATTRIDATMKESCTKLLGDFGCSGDYGNVQGTCDAAMDALGQAKAALGASATLSHTATPARCVIASQPMLDCLHKCDATFKGKADALKCDGTADASGCEGSWSTTKTSDGCNLACGLETMAQAQCTPERITMKIDGASDPKATETFRSAVEKDLAGALLQSAAHGPIAALVKKGVDLMKSLPKDMDHREATNKRLECFDAVTTDTVFTTSQVALEQVMSINLMTAGTLQKPHP